MTATDSASSSITGNATISVTAATFHFTVSAPTTAVAGTPFNFTVTILDASNAVVTSYTGTVHFTSTDPLVSAGSGLPANATLTSGTGIFSATLQTAGTQTITAADTLTSTISGLSNPISVSAGTATHFTVSGPATATVGTPATVTVSAFDAFNNAATGYAGTVKITSTDALATLPANGTLTSGTGTFSVTFKTPGSQTVSASDVASSSITGTSAAISVSAGAATHFTVSAPSSAVVGTPISVTVTALDVGNNTVAGYTGIVHFTSTDAAAVLPANTTLTSGTGTFSATLNTVGAQTISAAGHGFQHRFGHQRYYHRFRERRHHHALQRLRSDHGYLGFAVSVTTGHGPRQRRPPRRPAYLGTQVHFTSTDALAGLPVDSTLASSVSCPRLRSRLQTTRPSRPPVVLPPACSNGDVYRHGRYAGVNTFTTVALGHGGTAFSLTITANDTFATLPRTILGTVTHSNSHLKATMGADSTLVQRGQLRRDLKAAGTQTVTPPRTNRTAACSQPRRLR